jgi:hypothetical protein
MEYSYNLTTTNNGKCIPIRLHREVKQSSIQTLVCGVRKDDTMLYVEFAEEISTMEHTTLGLVVEAHSG